MENIVNIILENYNNKPIILDTSKLKLRVNKYNIEYNIKNGKIYVTIKSKEKLFAIYKHFMIHYKLFFFNNGYFYKIKEYRENNKIIDIKKYIEIDVYKTNKENIKNYKITSIENLINRESIKEFNKLEKNINLYFQPYTIYIVIDIEAYYVIISL